MTGEAPEGWAGFTFSNLRWWPLLMVPFGGVVHVAVGAMERRASGKLPVTRAARRTLRRAGWQGIALLGAGFLSWAGIALIAIGVGPHAFDRLQSAAAGVLFLAGLSGVVGGGVVHVILRRKVGPQGAVRRRRAGDGEPDIEIWNLHPAFVTAFRENQASVTG